MINPVLRLMLALWILAYVAVACAPLVVGDVGSGLGGLLVGGILFLPWFVVLIALGVFVWLTNPPGRRR